jgi:hypothetical protein
MAWQTRKASKDATLPGLKTAMPSTSNTNKIKDACHDWEFTATRPKCTSSGDIELQMFQGYE